MSMDDFFKYELPRIKRMESEAFYTLAREEGFKKRFEEGSYMVSVAKKLLIEGISLECTADISTLSLEKITIIPNSSV